MKKPEIKLKILQLECELIELEFSASFASENRVISIKEYQILTHQLAAVRTQLKKLKKLLYTS